MGLSGSERQVLTAGWAAGMAIVTLITFLDVVTVSHAPGRDPLARALVLEVSSLVTMTVALWIPAGVALWLRRRRPPLWQALLGHLAALPVYFAVHVGGFFLLRKLAYPLVLGRAYASDSLIGGALYEASKDVPAYLFAVAGFWLVLRWFGDRRPAPEGLSASFDIRDGARLVRAPVGEILAVRSAGNYVEFLLADGRSPLMRTALSALEAQLAPHRFVRTHRSWLVNPACVTGLRPDGSGDYTVELGRLEAPLSRRFPEALAALRG